MTSMFANAEIRVGKEYQVDIPPPIQRGTISPSSTPRDMSSTGKRSSIYRRRWTPRKCSEAQVMEFLRQFCRLNEIELGLECLNDSNFQVDKAVVLLHKSRRKKIRRQQEIDEKITPQDFEQMILKHGKVFQLVKNEFLNTSTKEMVEYFFHWKKSAQAIKWSQRKKSKKKKDKLRALAKLRYGAAEKKSSLSLSSSFSGTANDIFGAGGDGTVDSDDVSDYHNSYCEMCFTCGQLLCCDGCERAYHLSCVTPPLKEVPQEDWYCPICQSLLDSKQIQRHQNGNWMAKPMTFTMSQEKVSKLKVHQSDNEEEDIENSPRTERTMSLESIEDDYVQDELEDQVETNGIDSSSKKDSKIPPPPSPPFFTTKKNKCEENIEHVSMSFQSVKKNRKRHRKIEAPRHIPQSVLPSKE